jgi:hypothetical protein
MEVTYPVRNYKTNDSKKRETDASFASVGCTCDLRLKLGKQLRRFKMSRILTDAPHWNSCCELTDTDTSDDSGRNHLAKPVRARLQSSTDDCDHLSDRGRPSSTQDLAYVLMISCCSPS